MKQQLLQLLLTCVVLLGSIVSRAQFSVQDQPMEKQKLILDEAFENWRGKLEQIDDVLVIGVKV